MTGDELYKPRGVYCGKKNVTRQTIYNRGVSNFIQVVNDAERMGQTIFVRNAVRNGDTLK